MNRLQWLALPLVVVTALFSDPAHAQRAAPDPLEDRLMVTGGFLNGHPDLRFRLLALERREQNKQEEAFRFFQRAGFYGDKPSQAMVAEMLWNGTGTTQDKAQAYAWMDLAAERGYEGFLELRERYWAQLSEAERVAAVEHGQDIYARYGDEAALPRIAAVIRRERKKVTGSRTGFSSNLKIYVPGPAELEEIDGSKFYDERYWDPKQYQAWHDAIWKKPRVASVNVGDVETVPTPSSESRIPAVQPLIDAPEPVTDDAMPALPQPPARKP